VKSLETYVVTEAITKKRMVFEVANPGVSTDDTVTLGDFTTIASVHLCKKSDGAEIACTKATNVITVTEAALTNVAAIGFAVGV
jgi:hypothetical protein